MKRFVKFFYAADGINLEQNINTYAEDNDLLLITVSGDEGFHRALVVFEKSPDRVHKTNFTNGCDGCYHNHPCSYFEDEDSTNKSEKEMIEEHCYGCCCGDGLECNKGLGCENYETEEEVEEYGSN